MVKNEAFINNYEKHILNKINGEIISRYNIINYDKSRILDILHNKICIPYIDFSIGTSCSLRCKDCTQWNPYIPHKVLWSYDDVKAWTEKMFKSIQNVIFLTILGGEPLLNADIDKILRYFSDLRDMGGAKLSL